MATQVEITNWDEYWVCQHEREDERNAWSATFSLIMGIAMANEYTDKYEKSWAKMKNIAERTQQISLDISKHHREVIHPQIVHAMSAALAMPLPGLGIDPTYHDARASDRAAIAEEVMDRYLARYSCEENPDCDNSLAIAGAEAATDTAYSRRQYNQRRFERRMQFKRGIVERAHAATMQSPGPIFQLLNSAAQIYSTIFNNAQSNLAGAMSSIGHGLAGVSARVF